MRRLLCIAAVVTTLSPVVEAQAAMGLKCSQFLDARAYIRFDPRTNQFTDVRPQTVPPVSKDVDEKMGWVNWYLLGHLAERRFLDAYLAKMGAGVDVLTKGKATDEILREMTAIENLCRNGLRAERQDYDVADVIDRHAIEILGKLMTAIVTMLERAHEAGRQSR
jgi:hypothetical protein